MIREATGSDLAAVIALEEACQGDGAWSAALIREGLEGTLPTVQYLVVVPDGLDGTVQGYAVASYAGDIAELQRIGVHPGARRRGLATELLAAVVAYAPGTGADRLLLEVREGNSGALSFYADSGFVEIDRRPRYYRDGRAAVVMRLPLMKGCGGTPLR